PRRSPPSGSGIRTCSIRRRRSTSEFCRSRRNEEGSEAMKRRLFLGVMVVLTVAPARGQEPKPGPLDVRGTVQPLRLVRLTSQAPGRVAEVLVEEGQKVKAGEVLFR